MGVGWRAIRGRVRRARRGIWTWQVRDTEGTLVAFGHEPTADLAVQACRDATVAARGWWVYGVAMPR